LLNTDSTESLKKLIEKLIELNEKFLFSGFAAPVLGFNPATYKITINATLAIDLN
jgi:hypothetical protein